MQPDNEYCDPIARNAIECRIISLSFFALLERICKPPMDSPIRLFAVFDDIYKHINADCYDDHDHRNAIIIIIIILPTQ